MAVAAAVDEPDFCVDACESTVGEAVGDGGDDPVEVGSDEACEVDEWSETAAFG